MIPISEKSSGGALVDWVPEGHDRKYTEPAAMSIRIAATPSAWLTLMREARSVFPGIGIAIATMLLLVLGGAIRTLSPVVGRDALPGYP